MITGSLKIKNDRYYAVLNYKEGTKYKQKWISLNLPAKNNKRKAEAMLEEIKRDSEEKYSTNLGDELFTAYLRRWLKRKKSCIELSTWEGYQIYTEKHIIPFFEPLKLTLRELKPSHIQDYYLYKYTSGRLDGKPGGLSIPSIKKHSIVLKDALNEAVLSEMITKNPAAGVKMPAKNKTSAKRVFLTADEANVVLKAFKGHILQALVYTTLYYGLRRSEVLGLRWRAIDFQANTLTINHVVVKNRSIIEKDTTKSQASTHTYLLIPDVREALLEQKRRQEQWKEELGETYKDNDYVFTWKDGTLFRPDYVTRGFQRVLKSHGLQKMRFHDLRHSTSSTLYDQGWDLKDIQEWMRHSSIEVTGDIYTHITEDRKSKLASQFNSTFKM